MLFSSTDLFIPLADTGAHIDRYHLRYCHQRLRKSAVHPNPSVALRFVDSSANNKTSRVAMSIHLRGQGVAEQMLYK